MPSDVISETYVRSVIDCTSMCSVQHGCTAVNLQTASNVTASGGRRLCQLLDYGGANPSVVVPDNGWNFYELYTTTETWPWWLNLVWQFKSRFQWPPFWNCSSMLPAGPALDWDVFLHTDSDTSKNTKATFKSWCALHCCVRTVYKSLNSSIHHVNKSSEDGLWLPMWRGNKNNNTSSPFTL